MLSICFSADERIFEISLGCSTYEKEKHSREKGIATDLQRSD